MKAFKAFVKPFEALQRSVKMKIKLIIILIQLSKMHGVGEVKTENASFFSYLNLIPPMYYMNSKVVTW